MTTDAIYRRAFRQGWTRIAAARRERTPAPPPDPAPEPAGEPGEAASGAEPQGPPPLELRLAPPPEPRPAPAVDTGRLAASALEGAAALLSEGRLEEAAAYLKLADMGSRIVERGPAEAATPEQAARWEAARDFYTGKGAGQRDLPVREQWRMLGLLFRHAREREHVLDALRRGRRTGEPCPCALCEAVEATAPAPAVEALGSPPATEAETVALLSDAAAGVGAGPAQAGAAE